MLHDIPGLSRQPDLSNGDIGPKLESARVNQRKHAPIPVAISINAVAGGTRHIFDNGDALADHSIEKGGFTDIRSAHDGNKWLHIGPSTLSAHKAAPARGANVSNLCYWG